MVVIFVVHFSIVVSSESGVALVVSLLLFIRVVAMMMLRPPPAVHLIGTFLKRVVAARVHIPRKINLFSFNLSKKINLIFYNNYL